MTNGPKAPPEKRRKGLSLYPLSFEDALANLIAVEANCQGHEVPPEAQVGPHVGSEEPVRLARRPLAL